MWRRQAQRGRCRGRHDHRLDDDIIDYATDHVDVVNDYESVDNDIDDNPSVRATHVDRAGNVAESRQPAG